MSGVNVSRTLQELRPDKLIELKRNPRLVVLDRKRLTEVSGFDPAYLHLNDVAERS